MHALKCLLRKKSVYTVIVAFMLFGSLFLSDRISMRNFMKTTGMVNQDANDAKKLFTTFGMLSEDAEEVSRFNFSRCQDNLYPQLESTTNSRAIVVKTCGNITQRIRQYSIALDRIRSHLISTNRSIEWNLSSPDQIRLLGEWKDDFLHSLSNYSQIKAVILPWLKSKRQERDEWSSLKDTSNVLIQKYYESTASDPLCKWIETPGTVGFSFDIINNWTCNRDIKRAIIPKSVSLLALNALPPYKGYYFPSIYPPHFFKETPRFVYISYVIRKAIVAPKGNVFVANARVVPYECFPRLNHDPPTDAKNIPYHMEVLVLSQHFGENIYHRMIEVIPRIGIFVDFLQRNPTVKLHTMETGGRTEELLNIFGLTRNRIVTGWCRAEIVYLPRGSMCTFANIPEIQIISRLYRSYIEKHLQPETRNKIVLIRRSSRRYFNEQGAIEKVVQMAANAYNLSFEIYRDNPPPSLADTMRMFNSAVMVIASHGAGLANLVFSEPGTYVIEGVCNLPYAHLFFQRLALALGHRHHGIPATGGCQEINSGGVFGSVNIPASVINSTVLAYLELYAQEKIDV